MMPTRLVVGLTLHPQGRDTIRLLKIDSATRELVEELDISDWVIDVDAHRVAEHAGYLTLKLDAAHAAQIADS